MLGEMKTNALFNPIVHKHTKKCVGCVLQAQNGSESTVSLFSQQANITVTMLFVVHTETQAYLAPPAIGGYCVHDWLQAECMIPFITHVTHQHLAVFPWVPVDQTGKKGYYSLKIPQRVISDTGLGAFANKTY